MKTTMEHRAHELDVVELVTQVGAWPVGTRGVVVSEDPRTALVEAATEHQVDSDGLPERPLFDDLFSAPYTALRVVQASAVSAG